jgi:hypothetical protein
MFLTVHDSKEIEVRTAGGASRGDARLEIGDLQFQLTATYLRELQPRDSP